MNTPYLRTDDHGFQYLDGFRGQKQAQETWCWAAAASTINNYYETRLSNRSPKFRPQCYYVKAQLKRAACRDYPRNYERRKHDCHARGCSIDGGPEIGEFDDALDELKQDLLHDVIKSPVGYTRIRDEILKGHPVGMRVLRNTISPHLVVVYGFHDSTPSLLIWDPAHGSVRISYNSTSREMGRWTHTIITTDRDRNSAAQTTP